MSAASVDVVVTSGERHEGKAWCCLQVKLCDPCLSALCVLWCKKALPFLSFTRLCLTFCIIIYHM